MKTTLRRIITLSLALGLAGVLTAASGAESVINLISQGEAATVAVKSGKAALDAATTKNNDLASQGRQIQAEQQQLQTDIAALTTKENGIKKETADYKSNCQDATKRLSADEYKTCKTQHDQIQNDITQINTQPPILKKRQDDFISRANKYNQEVKTAPNQIRIADANYRSAVAGQEQWLDEARNLVASPAFQPYAKKAGCPDVMKPPKSFEGIMSMSDSILTCLKKVAGTS